MTTKHDADFSFEYPDPVETLLPDFDERADEEYERELGRLERLRQGDDAPYSYED